MDYLGATLEIKAVQAQQRIISGFAAGISNEDRVKDVIDPGAFTKTLATKTPGDVAVFIGHKQDSLPVGIPLVIQATPQGLYTETLVKPGPAGDDLLATAEFLQRHGHSLGMSIGYRVPPGGAKMDRGTDGKLIRRLMEIDLFEYSFAASQSIANPKALVVGVKQMGDAMYHIEQQGAEYVVLDADGEEEGRYATRALADAALARLKAAGDESPEAGNKTADEAKADWTTAYVNALPDSSFLYVEPGGQRDDEGKVVPRDKRHFPYKDASGAIDLPHLRNAIARIPQATTIGLDDAAKRRLQSRARRLLEQAQGSKTVEDDAAEWKGAAPLDVRWVGYELLDVSERIAAEHKAMALLGDDTKAGQRVRGEMRAKLKELAKTLNDIAEWADYVDAERDGAAKVAHWRKRLALMDLAG